METLEQPQSVGDNPFSKDEFNKLDHSISQR